MDTEKSQKECVVDYSMQTASAEEKKKTGKKLTKI